MDQAERGGAKTSPLFWLFVNVGFCLLLVVVMVAAPGIRGGGDMAVCLVSCASFAVAALLCRMKLRRR